MLRGAPDAQRGHVFFWWARFLGRPRWSEGPRLFGRGFLVGFRADFVTSVCVSDAFAGVLGFGPQGPENPKGGAPSAPLRTSLPESCPFNETET